MDQGMGYTAQKKPREAGPTMGADHDQIYFHAFGLFVDGIDRISQTNDGIGLERCLLAKCLSDAVHPFLGVLDGFFFEEFTLS